MNLFQIDYQGVYLGGTAIVLALDEKQALETLRADPKSFGAVDPKVTPVFYEPGPCVIYNDNGDY